MVKNRTVTLALAALLLLATPASLLAATLAVSPASGTYEVGDRVTARVVVSSDVSINAISGELTFPSARFTVESVSKTDSVLNFWVAEPSFSKADGTVRFEGVALSGFKGNSGTVVTVVLRAISAGSATVSFKSGRVLANDGQGTDSTGALSGATFTVIAAKVAPPAPAPAKKPAVAPEPTVPEEPIAPEEPAAPAQPAEPLPSLSTPSIVATERYGAPTIVGTSGYPRAQVLLTFMSEAGVKVFITGRADDDGGFSLAVPESLKSGAYRVSAVMVADDGTRLESSQEVVSRIGSLASDTDWKIWTLIGVLSALVLGLSAALVSATGKKKRDSQPANATIPGIGGDR